MLKVLFPISPVMLLLELQLRCYYCCKLYVRVVNSPFLIIDWHNDRYIQFLKMYTIITVSVDQEEVGRFGSTFYVFKAIIIFCIRCIHYLWKHSLKYWRKSTRASVLQNQFIFSFFFVFFIFMAAIHLSAFLNNRVNNGAVHQCSVEFVNNVLLYRRVYG